MKKHIIISLTILALSCNTSKKENKDAIEIPKPEMVETPILNLEQANRLAQLPLHCMEIEYPNRLGQTLGSDADLLSPKTLHPAFYGCFDWHSSVHGHWSLVRLLKTFPEIEHVKAIKERLLKSISKENILTEVAFFEGEQNKSFERTYGWAWLLKLAQELHTWDAPVARTLETNLQPLTDLISNKYVEFLPKLNYPLRVGTHANTAFGLSFAYDYAETVQNDVLKTAIITRANDFFLNDKDCPMSWEPSGSDFLSPCLEEAALMKRLLPKEEFKTWLDAFLPQLKNDKFTLEVGLVSDRTDGQLVHLDGVNFSRAWCLNNIAEGLPEYKHLKNIANQHINYSLPSIVGDSYEGGHWLGSFAIYALSSVKNE
ncbi:MAG: DUF2891 domain-containing protein [Flavobacteriales bacterium]|nr:DUF2891 domain-containing protein [Flavobacteriia bacterium]NCP05294.1 DUF2891 domain-containing protein [Flavobacteriales bacterium]PIV95065.1 MAG: DUF2891 domain-containing protein [Flavobacteriaceae bacterium CG17_big_fil_post_rev_8_21_14_2_50_33_15]PIY09289.1 MAG: DUF2891 domain-containing protein [Flavobacteriaceae bacterium CG_4_10_14_3_um_filter_33_47]PJB20263.1 MAG: DUF2891 domain-containing protein [Flavobacteriaceae bacterium CG_4_9_14_3_um_filter_33_16]